MTDTFTEALPDLTAKELLVWDACCAWDKVEPGCDVWLSYLRDETGGSGYVLSGLLTSMQRKGYIHKEQGSEDVQLSCRARRMHYLTPQNHCLNAACCP